METHNLFWDKTEQCWIHFLTKHPLFFATLYNRVFIKYTYGLQKTYFRKNHICRLTSINDMLKNLYLYMHNKKTDIFFNPNSINIVDQNFQFSHIYIYIYIYFTSQISLSETESSLYWYVVQFLIPLARNYCKPLYSFLKRHCKSGLKTLLWSLGDRKCKPSYALGLKCQPWWKVHFPFFSDSLSLYWTLFRWFHRQ